MAFGSGSWSLYPENCGAVDTAADVADVAVPDAAPVSAVKDVGDISRRFVHHCKTLG